jgi:uncharacterized protein
MTRSLLILIAATSVGIPAAVAGQSRVVTAAAPEATLVEAVKAGNAAKARALLQRRADVNVPDADGSTALHWAIHRDDLDTANLLIRAGANVHAANRYGVPPLSLACTNANAAAIELLLKAGADPNVALPEGETALLTAARTGNPEAVKVLLTHGADIKAKETWKGQDALMWAAAEGHRLVVDLLVERGADVNSTSKEGYTPLMFAARQGHLEIAKRLVAAGANVNATQTQGMSPLMLAIYNSNWDLAGFMLENGANPNINASGFTPLHLTITIRRPEVLQFTAPASTNTLSGLDFIKALLARGADPNARMTKGFINLRTPLDMPLIGATPFFLAAKTADAPLMRLLVASGADPLLTTEEGATPLMAAAGVGYRQGESPGTEAEALEAVTLAAELGGNVNAANGIGFTALHGAAVRGANSIIQFLVDHGARLNIKDKRGRTAFTIADEGAGDSNQRRQLQTAAFLRELMTRSR